MAYVSQADKKSLAPAIKAVLNKYGMKGSIRVRNHSTLCVTVKSGAIDLSEYMRGEAYIDVNEYWIDQHYNGIARDFLNELLEAMKGPNYFNNDDAMTDYFHRSHYKKTQRQLDVGKRHKVVNTSPPVLVVRSQVVVLIY